MYLNHEVVLASYRVDLQLALFLGHDGHAAVHRGGRERADLDGGAARPEVDGEGEVGEAVLEARHRGRDGRRRRHLAALI